MALSRGLIFLAVLEFLLASCFCANLNPSRKPHDLLLENLKKSYRGEMVHVKVITEFQIRESSNKMLTFIAFKFNLFESSMTDFKS